MFSQSTNLSKRVKPILRMQLERYRVSYELLVLLYGDSLCNIAIYAIHQIFFALEGQECELENGRKDDIWPKTQAKISSIWVLLTYCWFAPTQRATDNARATAIRAMLGECILLTLISAKERRTLDHMNGRLDALEERCST